MKKPEQEKLDELENLIKTQSKDIRKLKRTDEKLTEVKFVNVQFDVKKYKEGEGVINDAIKDGFEIRRDFQTDSGIVVCLGKYKPKNQKTDGDDEK